jgi:antibiotic biosynthesis monooxygenase (ABM) superfamily enzyme
VHRADRFVVPAQARDTFLAEVRTVLELVRTLPGYLHDLMVEQPSDGGRFDFVTVVEWDSPASIENAETEIEARHRQRHFDPQERFAELGIEADMAHYEEVAVDPLG